MASDCGRGNLDITETMGEVKERETETAKIEETKSRVLCIWCKKPMPISDEICPVRSLSPSSTPTPTFGKELLESQT